VVAAVVAVGVDHSTLVYLLSAEKAASMLADGVVGRRPALVVTLGAVAFKHGAKVDPDDDPPDGVGAANGAEDGENGCVLTWLRQKTENFQRLRIEDQLLPSDTFVGGVEQFVGGALCLEILNGGDDSAMIADVEVVVAFQHLG